MQSCDLGGTSRLPIKPHSALPVTDPCKHFSLFPKDALGSSLPACSSCCFSPLGRLVRMSESLAFFRVPLTCDHPRPLPRSPKITHCSPPPPPPGGEWKERGGRARQVGFASSSSLPGCVTLSKSLPLSESISSSVAWGRGHPLTRL